MHRDSLISFIRFIQGFYVFKAKLRCIVSSAWLPGSPLWCAPLQLKSRLDPHLPFRASTWFPELEIRHQAHQEASGTHKWKGMAAANVTQQLRACLGSLQAPRGPSAQVSGALSNNKRSAIWDSLYLNYLEKKKKNLCQVSTLHVVHPLSQCSLWSWNRLPPLSSHTANSP